MLVSWLAFSYQCAFWVYAVHTNLIDPMFHYYHRFSGIQIALGQLVWLYWSRSGTEGASWIYTLLTCQQFRAGNHRSHVVHWQSSVIWVQFCTTPLLALTFYVITLLNHLRIRDKCLWLLVIIGGNACCTGMQLWTDTVMHISMKFSLHMVNTCARVHNREDQKKSRFRAQWREKQKLKKWLCSFVKLLD